MLETIKALVQHLRERQHRITRKVTVTSVEYDPTFGPRERNEEVDAVDFDALLTEIDEFAATFQKEGNTP